MLPTGLPILWRVEKRKKEPDVPSIVFFEQPSIPVHPLQRRFPQTTQGAGSGLSQAPSDLQTTDLELNELTAATAKCPG